MAKKIKQIGVIANMDKPQARQVLQRLAQTAKLLSLKLYTCDKTARRLPSKKVGTHQVPRTVDAIIALGGDGTMLRAVHTLQGAQIPVLGVNLGNLGFMTSVTEENLERALDAMAKGRYEISTRAMAQCTLTRGRKKIGEYHALNDVVIGWGQSSRIITLDVSINGEQITSYRCDGLIVSTPTGSTAHSLSAGGPILHPETPAFLINVLCPHTLSARPIVFMDQSVIGITVAHTPKKLLLSIDGQEEQPVQQGDQLLIRRSPRTVHFLHLPKHSYFSILRQKLQWRGSSLINS